MTIYAPTDSQIDFQVQAWAGYYFAEWVSMNIPDHPLAGGMASVFHGQKSDWSNIHTLNMANAAVSVSASTEPAPTSTIASVEVTIDPTVTVTTPVLPTQTPTEAPIQPNAQTDLTSGITWKDMALIAACIVIAVLAVVLVLSRRKRA
jgi:hypothetical protein